MKFLKYYFFLIIGLTLFLSSCKNDVELNAPYKEIPSIFAVLNPYEKFQMIRINKVFLGVGDANLMAKVEDSINYKAGDLEVSLRHSSGGASIVFRDSMVYANDGAFNRNQRVYVTEKKLKTDGTYTLTVKNINTGNVFTAKASPVPRIDTSRIAYGDLTRPHYPYKPGTKPQFYIDYANARGSIIYTLASENAKIYQLLIRTYFYNDLGSGVKSDDAVDYVFGNKYPSNVTTLAGGTYMREEFSPADYFAAVGIALSRKNLTNNVLGRKTWMIEYHIYASTQEYLDYMEYTKPSLSFNQNKPLYSNFDQQTALGLFTFRSETIVQKEMASTFINAFSSNPNTCQYKFYDSNNQLLGCK